MNKPARVPAVPVAQRRVDVPGTGDKIDLKTMGGRIAWARLRRQMSQVALSAKMGKSRATIVQYEQDNIIPPITEVVKLAVSLDVSPEFIAFGRHGVEGLTNAAEEIVTIPEIKEGRDGQSSASSYALPRSFFGERDIDPHFVSLYVLNHDEPTFGYHTGDRLMVDRSAKAMGPGHDHYLLKSDTGFGVVRREPNFGGSGKGSTIIMTGNGSTHQVAPDDLDIVGAVVGKMSLSA